MNKIKEIGTINKSVDFIRNHLGVIIPLVYLYLVFLGMLNAYVEYDPYNIDIFEFSTLEDFFLGVFRKLWLFSLGLFIAIFSLTFLLSLESKFVSDSSFKSYVSYMLIVVALIPLVVIGIKFWNSDDRAIKRDLIKQKNKVDIILRHRNINDAMTDKKEGEYNYYFLGIQGGYVFIVPYNENDPYRDPIIIPVSNISTIKKFEPPLIDSVAK